MEREAVCLLLAVLLSAQLVLMEWLCILSVTAACGGALETEEKEEIRDAKAEPSALKILTYRLRQSDTRAASQPRYNDTDKSGAAGGGPQPTGHLEQRAGPSAKQTKRRGVPQKVRRHRAFKGDS
ncbi:hypothetical protein EYF80_002301 [Liparis tanakae]|uniref:Secreted protein n=1 Tax=Liparis tanakae TaxID=230148 RepID=A0A4Z2JCN3_9TELE|nr:hypothetical protein EYF80_002301 [Liparis tanakae]